MTLNLISGFSVWFFQTDEVAEIERSEAAKGGRRESAWRFKSFVKAYWPQLDPEPASAEGTAQRLYEVRNSLAHDLGVHDNQASLSCRHFRPSLAVPLPGFGRQGGARSSRPREWACLSARWGRGGSSWTILPGFF
jgi:hypothetical protein